MVPDPDSAVTMGTVPSNATNVVIQRLLIVTLTLMPSVGFPS